MSTDLGARSVCRPLRSQGRSGREEGQVAILILGLFALTLTLILGGIDVTAAQLARMRLLDAADSIALDAADALDEEAAYRSGLHGTLLLTDASVQRAAAAHLAQTPRPSGISHWSLAPPTGSADGQTAVVTLTGQVALPLSGWLLERLAGGVTITVRSRARAPLR